MVKKRNLLIGSVSVAVFAVLLIVIALVSSSYAAPTGVLGNDLPSSTFTTNYSSSTVKNYVKDALGTSSSYSSYYNNFNVAPNLSTNDNKYPMYSLMKNLAFPKTTESIELVDNPKDITNKSIMYIIAHGYNSTNTLNTVFSNGAYGVSDNNIKQYVTQMALWLYLYENKASNSTYCIDTGAGVNACDFYSGTNTLMPASTVRTMITEAAKKSEYGYLNYIITLVDQAKAYTSEESSSLSPITFDGSYTIGDNEKYLVTSSFTPAVKSNKTNFMYYTLELNDPNGYGAYFVNNANVKIENTTNFNGSFKIYVPIKDGIDKIDLSSLTVNVYGYFAKLTGYNYRITKSTVTSDGSIDNLMNNYNGTKYQKYANLVLAKIPYEGVKISFSLSNLVKISKVDATNNNELPGATLEVTKKGSASSKWSWVSTDKPHYLYLEEGEYELCEKIAPDGYELSQECVSFKVEKNKPTSVEMKNQPIPIPNTGSSVSIMFYILGLISLGLGMYAVYLIVGKKEQKN